MTIASYSKNNAWPVDAGSRSIMKEPHMQLDDFGWIQVVCRGASQLLVRRHKSKEFDPPFRQSLVREPG